MSETQQLNNIFDEHLGNNFKETSYDSVFNYFDTNSDSNLDRTEFQVLIEQLSVSEDRGPTEDDVNSIFNALDLNQDGLISREEFSFAWKYCIKQILKPVKALVVVDVQNDFITGTLSLRECPAGQDGYAVVPVINSLLEPNLFDVVVYTLDWHPDNHISFIDNALLRKLHPSSKVSAEEANIQDKVIFDVDGSSREQVMWPRHCVQKTTGAELHPDLKIVNEALYVKKGNNPDVDSYSAFWDNCRLSQTNLASLLGERHVTDVYVCGLAYDVCVGFTAKHALKHGFKTVLIEDASRGVSLDGIYKMKNDLIRKGAHIVDSEQVPRLTSGELRPFCFLQKAAMNYKVALELSINNNK
ncbi:pyrazinamidase/nicotinamidase [Biomphalaria glabrata]|nr:pyrazinamidase/nicotinamidase [Biomphalaria glabrata]